MSYDENWYEWYKGIPSTFEPEFGELYTGYKLNPERIGETTNPSLADQVSAVAEKLRQGMKKIEIGPISPELFESIPKQHFGKLKDLAKLAGAEISIHAPISPNIDIIGLGERGGWSEENRKEAERRLMNLVDRSHDIDPKGNIPITIHATMATTEDWTKEGKNSITVINPETGEMGGISGKVHVNPKDLASGKEIKPRTPEEELKIVNENMWVDQLNEVYMIKKGIDDRLGDAKIEIEKLHQIGLDDALKKVEQRNTLNENEMRLISRFEDIQKNKIMIAQRDIQTEFLPVLNSVFNKAYSDKEVRDKLKEFGKEYNKEIERNNELIKNGEKEKALERLYHANEKLLENLNKINPQTYKPFYEFAEEKASDTISNVAIKSYDKHKNSAPILAIENIFPGIAFSRAEDLKDLINESRKKFVEKAAKEGIGKSEAEEAAEKLIGATWDISHINMLKKKGFEEEHIISQTKKIAPYIKKVHISDNFGFSDAHLAPGMGNVATKKHMEAIDKATKEKFRGTVIAELGGLHQYFKVPSAYPYALEAMGSSLYSPRVASYWERVPSRSSLIPESDYGWAPLPKELGGRTQKQQYSTS